jgi:hypothetical protein
MKFYGAHIGNGKQSVFTVLQPYTSLVHNDDADCVVCDLMGELVCCSAHPSE